MDPSAVEFLQCKISICLLVHGGFAKRLPSLNFRTGVLICIIALVHVCSWFSYAVDWIPYSHLQSISSASWSVETWLLELLTKLQFLFIFWDFSQRCWRWCSCYLEISWHVLFAVCHQPSRRIRSLPWQHDLLEDSIRAAGITGVEVGTKLYVSNLDFGVTNEDIRVQPKLSVLIIDALFAVMDF